MTEAGRQRLRQKVASWKDYQEQAAAFFRGLDLAASTNERIVGVRGSHDVDVAVRSETAGIKQLWIVECKQWKKRVNKLHVAALAEIVRDTGADRGVLLSETGFQAGAVRMARASNITLSSIADLEENSELERVELGLIQLRKRLSRLRGNIKTLEIFGALRMLPSDLYSNVAHVMQGVDMDKALSLISQAATIESALTAAEAGQFPSAQTPNELLAELIDMAAKFENGLTELETTASEARERLP